MNLSSYFFQFNDFTGRFYANCDIRAGEEITVMYCDLLKSQKIRQETLLKTHRFTCDCEVCGNPNDAGQIQASDSNRLRIKQTIDKLSSSSPKAIELADLQRAIVAADQDGLVTHKAQIFYLGGVLISERELAKPALALSWLREAKRLYAALEGEESHHVAELRICIGS